MGEMHQALPPAPTPSNIHWKLFCITAKITGPCRLRVKTSGDQRSARSGLLQRATVTRTTRHSHFVPLPDSRSAATASLFDHLVSAAEQRDRKSDAERVGGFCPHRRTANADRRAPGPQFRTFSRA